MADFNTEGTCESNKADNVESESSVLENKSVIKQDGEGVGCVVQANPDTSIADTGEVNKNLENTADSNIFREAVEQNLDSSPILSVGTGDNCGVVNQEGLCKLADASHDCEADCPSKNGSIGDERKNIARDIYGGASIADSNITDDAAVSKGGIELKELTTETKSQERQGSEGMGCTSNKEKKDEYEVITQADVSEDENRQGVLRKLRDKKTNDDDDDNDDAYNGFEDMSNEEYFKKKKEADEKYEYFWRDQDICSQWHRSHFEEDGVEYSCAEQYMMYQKAVLFDDRKIARKILHAKHPRNMKSLGRKVKGFSADLWNYHCLDVVKNGNLAKFSQNITMKEQLYSTYPKILVEASPYDTIWGIGLVKDDPVAFDESTWEGKNLLGYILTEVRDELMCNDGIIEEKHKKMYLDSLREELSSSVDGPRQYATWEKNVHQGTEMDDTPEATIEANIQASEKIAGEVNQNKYGNTDEQQAENLDGDLKGNEQENPSMEGQIGVDENEATGTKPDSSKNENNVKKENDEKESMQEVNDCEGTKSESKLENNAEPVKDEVAELEASGEPSDDHGERETIDTGIGTLAQTQV